MDATFVPWLWASVNGRVSGNNFRFRTSHTLIRSRAAITAQDRVLQSLSYKNVLKRGFAVVRVFAVP
ncbi:hypothetical protein ACCT03_34440 [Rhizobium johnstonii]|uniref:hypothetical protein n=1 Tax=Rhizobium johnstonii TaxID=3019933 RepID=UPI003F9DC04A